MSNTAFATSGEYVAALSQAGLVRQEELGRAEEFTRRSPATGPRELAAFLVKEGVLTRMQADFLLEGRVAELKLAAFTLVNVLGTGTMGAVYKARSSKDDGWYAVKIVPRRNVANLNAVAEKVKALKQVRHPRVSALVNIGAAGDQVYLVWPYIEGGQRLDDALRKHGKLPPRQAAQIALQVASGLQPYHEQGLFHGLLKPSDVLIGADRRVRVLDFGVGFLLTSDRGKAVLDTMTNGKTLAKGLDCASPESIMDSLARTPAGDQYSLGCILYRCLTGQYPFPDSNPVKKMLAHQNEYPTPVRQLSPETPPALEAVVGRLMEKAPEDRYPDIGEAVKELQGLTSNARAFPAATPRSKPTVVLPQRAAEKPPEERPEGQEPPKAEAAPARNQTAAWIVAAGLAAGGAAGLLIWWMMHG